MLDVRPTRLGAHIFTSQGSHVTPKTMPLVSICSNRLLTVCPRIGCCCEAIASTADYSKYLREDSNEGAWHTLPTTGHDGIAEAAKLVQQLMG